MHKSGRGSYDLNNGTIAAIVITILLLAANFAMLVTVLAIGVNTAKSVNSGMISGLVAPALSDVMNSVIPEDKIIDLVRQAIQRVIEENDLITLLAGMLAASQQQQTQSASGSLPINLDDIPQLPDFDNDETKRRAPTCAKINDNDLCSQARSMCSTFSHCLRTYNETVCTDAARRLGVFCLNM